MTIDSMIYGEVHLLAVAGTEKVEEAAAVVVAMGLQGQENLLTVIKVMMLLCSVSSNPTRNVTHQTLHADHIKLSSQ